jgi:tetratricopeptide (TPR) repeat protein
MDSRSRRAIALQAQLAGNYRTAVREYIKSLDGAGEDAAHIHYQIGLCYQRLEDRESAVAHYTDALAEYKRLAASGRNVEAANRGIKSCDAGIKACQ